MPRVNSMLYRAAALLAALCLAASMALPVYAESTSESTLLPDTASTAVQEPETATKAPASDTDPEQPENQEQQPTPTPADNESVEKPTATETRSQRTLPRWTSLKKRPCQRPLRKQTPRIQSLTHCPRKIMLTKTPRRMFPSQRIA